MTSLEAWWRLLRYHYTASSFLAAGLGGAIAWAGAASFDWARFLVITAALILNQLALNVTDDYFDHAAGVDRVKDSAIHVYTSGSGVLASGLVAPRSARRAYRVLFTAGIAMMIALALTGRPWLLAFMAFGLFYSYFYTAPPVRLAYRGLGEMGFIVCFGPLIGGAVHYVASGTVSLAVLQGTLPLGLIQFAMICIQEIVDHDEDVAGGKRNLVVRFGKDMGIVMHVAGMLVCYACIVASVVLLHQPAGLLAAVGTVPWAAHIAWGYARSYRDPPALEAIIAHFPSYKLHNVVALLLVAAYLWDGFARGRPVAGGTAVALAVAAANAPILAAALSSARRSAKPSRGTTGTAPRKAQAAPVVERGP